MMDDMTTFQKVCLWTGGLCLAGILGLVAWRLVSFKMDQWDRRRGTVRAMGCFETPDAVYCPGFICDRDGFLDPKARTCVPFDPMKCGGK